MDINSFLINVNTNIYEAIAHLNSLPTVRKCAYIVDHDKRLVGAMTDGDVRRGLINRIDFNSCTVDKIMFKEPRKVIQLNYKLNDVMRMMKDEDLYSVPILNTDMQVIDIIFEEQSKIFISYTKKSNKVFILAGGIGSRLEPFTKILPKPLIPLGDKPILEILMDNFSKYGFSEFIVSVNYKADMIKAYLSDKTILDGIDKLDYIHEDEPLGTIGSLALAKNLINDTFFIGNADTIINEDFEKIFNFHKENNSDFTILGCLKETKIPYGVINVDNDNVFVNITEKPSYRHIINSGIYVAEPCVLDYIRYGERMDIPELIEALSADGRTISVFPVMEEQWYDVGNWSEYDRVRLFFE